MNMSILTKLYTLNTCLFFLFINYVAIKSLKNKVMGLDARQPNNGECPPIGNCALKHFSRRTEPSGQDLPGSEGYHDMGIQTAHH